MKIKTKLILTFAPALSLAIVALIWIQFAKPWLLKTLQQKIPTINEMQSVANVNVEKLDFSLLKLQGTLENIDIRFNTDPENKISIPHIKIQIDPFNLLIGQIKISYIKIDLTKAELNQETFLNADPSDTLGLNLKPLFNVLPKIPIQKIVLNKTLVVLKSPTLKSKLSASSEVIVISNKTDQLPIQINPVKVTIESESQTTIFKSRLKLVLTENNIDINQLELEADKSFIKFSGQIQNIKTLFKEPKFQIDTKGLIIFENIKPLVFHFIKTVKRLPQVLGQLKFEGQIVSQNFHRNYGRFKFETENFQFDFIKFGNALIQTKITNNEISFDRINLNHPSGEVQLTDVELQQKKPFNFKSKVKISNFNLQKLFSSLDLKDIPADLNAEALGQCSGQIENFVAQCDAKMIIEKALVRADTKSNIPIVAIDKALINTQTQFTTQNFEYKALAQFKTTSFTSEGSVDFNQGFKMKFKSDGLQLSEIDNIANLKLKGLVSGDLEAFGTSKYGVIQTKNLKAQKFEIDRFQLGDFTTILNYQQGTLKIHDVLGSIDKSDFNGNISLNFINSLINGDINFTKLNGNSLVTLFSDHFNLPKKLQLNGLGQAQLKFEGPFDFWKLKYTLTGYLDRGLFKADDTHRGESFKKIFTNISSDGSKILFNDVYLEKQNGSIKITGDILTSAPKPELKLDIQSQNLKFEDIDGLIAIFPNTTGQLKLNGLINGHIDSPQLKTNLVLKDLFIDNQNLPISQGDIVINKNFINFNGQILGRQAQTFIQYPFNTQTERIFKAQLRDFNPFILLPLIQLPLPSDEYFSSITADIDLKDSFQTNHKFIGKINLQNFYLQRSTQNIKLQKPSEIIFTNGLSKMTPLYFKGADQQLEITQDGSILNIQGQFALRPFQFLVPFLDSLSGVIELNCGLNLQSNKLSLAGEGQIKNGFLQLKGFPYPLKEVSSKIDFSQSKIIISSVQAELNQSPLTGLGTINFVSSKNIDVNIQAESSRIDLEFPPQMQTSGFVKAKISGQWIPYTLRIDYLIDQGLITKEFTDTDENLKFVLQPNKFLPPQQLNLQAPTLLLDVNPKFQKGLFIKNQILEGVAFGELKITGSPEVPIITGRIDFKQNSKLIFKDKPFDIQTGYVVFNPNPDNLTSEVNPELFINANARVSEYDVNLLIQGLSKSLDIKPTSQPPLSTNDIFSLLALGFTASNQDQKLSSETQQKQTGYEIIASISNQSKFNKKIQEKLGLNVQIAPSVDSTKNIAVPKVIVSRKYGKKISASYARPLSGNQQSNEVKLQWLFHPDFSLNLNYQNQTSEQETNIIQNNKDDQGNYGLDLEYKKEFK